MYVKCLNVNVNLVFLVWPVLSHRHVNPKATGQPTSQPRQPNFPAVPGSRCHGDDVMLQHCVERRSRRRTEGETDYTGSHILSAIQPDCRQSRKARTGNPQNQSPSTALLVPSWDPPHCSNNMREIVHLQAGQCGNQIGAKVGKRTPPSAFYVPVNRCRFDVTELTFTVLMGTSQLQKMTCCPPQPLNRST